MKRFDAIVWSTQMASALHSLVLTIPKRSLFGEVKSERGESIEKNKQLHQTHKQLSTSHKPQLFMSHVML